MPGWMDGDELVRGMMMTTEGEGGSEEKEEEGRVTRMGMKEQEEGRGRRRSR